MRKRKVGRKFGREKAQRKALLSSVTEALFRHGRIETTESRAKEARRVADRAITIAKAGNLSARRKLEQKYSSKVASMLVKDIAPSVTSRHGGYTRIIKIGPRKGDRAPMVFLELVESSKTKTKK